MWKLRGRAGRNTTELRGWHVGVIPQQKFPNPPPAARAGYQPKPSPGGRCGHVALRPANEGCDLRACVSVRIAPAAFHGATPSPQSADCFGCFARDGRQPPGRFWGGRRPPGGGSAPTQRRAGRFNLAQNAPKNGESWNNSPNVSSMFNAITSWRWVIHQGGQRQAWQ